MMAPIPNARLVLNKVPAVTIYFWLIKVLATTVGQSSPWWPTCR
jgi:uncharacterized membrane-anchored protein